jgi:hypothetical protein
VYIHGIAAAHRPVRVAPVIIWMLITEIVAPFGAQQIYTPPAVPPPPPRLDDVDLRIIEAVCDVRQAKVWSILNMLSDDPGLDRAAGREARRKLWGRVRRLKRLKLIFGVGRNELAAVKPDRQPTRPRPRPRQLRRIVAQPPDFSAVSAGKSSPVRNQPDFNYPVERQLTVKDSGISHGGEKPEKIESGFDTEHVSAVARALAGFPRRQTRKWTGFLHGQRCWRGRLLVLSNGEVAPLIWCNRGRVLLQNVRDFPFREWLAWGAIREQDVRLYRHPAAIALGHLKAGVKEKASATKASAARLNGCCPVRPGHPPRGRPRRSASGGSKHFKCALR